MLTAVQGANMGVLDTIGNTLLIYAHGDKIGPWMQAMHFHFGLGALLSPLFVRGSMVIKGG